MAHANKAYEPSADNAVLVTDIMPGLMDLISGTSGSVIELTDYDGGRCYFAAAGIDGSQWKMGVVVPTANVRSSLLVMITVAVIIALFITVIVAAIMAGLIGKNVRAGADAETVCVWRLFGKCCQREGNSQRV